MRGGRPRALPDDDRAAAPGDELRALVGDDAAWAALFERPIGELIEDRLADDTVRGVVLTDALIGTFAGAHDLDLRQNRCFLYHVIGNGTGHWDVPVGGMGAVTAELEAAAARRGRRAAHRRRGRRRSSRAPTASPCASPTRGGGEHVAVAGHVLANVAPAVLDRLRGPAPSGTPPEGAQLKVNMLLARLPRLRDGAVDPRRRVRRHLPRQRGLRPARARPRRRRPPGALPERRPVRDLLPLADRPEHPRPRAAGGGRADADAVRAAPARAAVRGRPRRRRASARSAATLASLDSVLAEPRRSTACWRDADGRPCVEARSPLDLEAELGLPGGNIFHRDLTWPFAETDAEVGQLGRRDRPPARARVRRGRAPRRRGQRRPRAQRGDGRAAGCTRAGARASEPAKRR